MAVERRDKDGSGQYPNIHADYDPVACAEYSLSAVLLAASAASVAAAKIATATASAAASSASSAASFSIASAAVPGWFELGSTSFEWAKLVLSLLVTATLGGLAAWITNGQRRIAQGQSEIAAAQRAISEQQKDVAAAKLRLDLFEKRLEVFDEVWKHLSHAPGTSFPFAALTNLGPKAEFLFGAEIRDYIFEVHRYLTNIAMVEQTAEHDGHMPPDKVADHLAWILWCVNEATDGCRARFKPYLDFAAWRSATALPPMA